MRAKSLGGLCETFPSRPSRRSRLGVVVLLHLAALAGCERFGYQELGHEIRNEPDDPSGDGGGGSGDADASPAGDAGVNGRDAGPTPSDAGPLPSDASVGLDASLDASTGTDASMAMDAAAEAGMESGVDAGNPFQRRSITIDNGVVGQHINFPLLISLNATWLRSTGSGGEIASPSGFDIHFKSDDGQDLDHEIEQYNATTGILIAWVKLPLLQAGTLLYIHYGDPSITSSLENAGGVWTDYAGVWHMNADPDSTANNNDVSAKTAVTEQASGKIGAARGFNGTSSTLRIGSQDSLDDIFVNGGTVSAWISPVDAADFGTVLASIASKDTTVVARPLGQNPTNNGWNLLMGAAVGGSSIDFRYGFSGTGTTSTTHWRSQNQTYGGGRWLAVVLQYKPTTSTTPPTFFINNAAYTPGSSFAGGGSGLTPRSDAADTLAIGNRFAGDRAFDGVLDEVRVYRSRRSAQWIAAEYDNQNDPANFYTVSNPL